MKYSTNMKKLFRFGLLFIILVFTDYTFGQVNPNSPEYQRMKAKGLIAQPPHVTPKLPIPAMHLAAPGNGTGGLNPQSLGLKVPRDATFILAMGPNDDGSTGEITCPFTFCFYGTDETSFFINNNGNVSFGSSYGAYTSSGFPIAGFPMLAPFWGDVDTRTDNGPLGAVYYKTTPTAVIVIWDSVGYFYQHGDLLNSFELIFTNGADPLIGVGNNVAFSYATMQWTTGDASGGSGGFGGSPATVGVNKGDGTNYALVGLFDHAGTDYDGPGGANDGVGYLTNQYFTFDACQTNVIIIPPNGCSIPTLSEWGLIILALLFLALEMVYIRKRQYSLAIAGGANVSENRHSLFDRKYYFIILAVLLGIAILVFAVEIIFSISVPVRDIIGALVSSVILAYILHLLFAQRKE
jgi:hypothetical protein